MKTCSACRHDLPRNEFYKATSKCKACTRQAVKANRLAKIDYYRAYDRDRAKTPRRRANAARVLRSWRAADKRRTAAHNAAARMKVDKPAFCLMCGRENVPLQKHHPNYDQPKVFTWVCKPCHMVADKQRREQERKAS